MGEGKPGRVQVVETGQQIVAFDMGDVEIDALRGVDLRLREGEIACDVLVDAAGAWADSVAEAAGLAPPMGPPPLINNPNYANLENLGIAMFVIPRLLKTPLIGGLVVASPMST